MCAMVNGDTGDSIILKRSVTNTLMDTASLLEGPSIHMQTHCIENTQPDYSSLQYALTAKMAHSSLKI